MIDFLYIQSRRKGNFEEMVFRLHYLLTVENKKSITVFGKNAPQVVTRLAALGLEVKHKPYHNGITIALTDENIE